MSARHPPPSAAPSSGARYRRALVWFRRDLREIGVVPGMSGGSSLFANFHRRVDRYREARNFPAVKGPSYLSVHLR